MINQQSSKLKVIFLTDIHLQFDYLDKLQAKVNASQEAYSYCLVGGDIANCDYSNNTHNENEMIEYTNRILNRLAEFLKCPVIFVPGNHDSKIYFQQDYENCKQIVNLHGRSYRLAEGLQIYGLGGSLPAFTDQKGEEKVWEGYPFEDEASYLKEVNGIFKDDKSQICKIYLAHIGPHLSSTTINKIKQPIVFAGSKSLNNVVSHQNLILFLHGHVHFGAKYDQYRLKPFVNPGAFCCGYYCQILIERVCSKWKMTAINFMQIS